MLMVKAGQPVDNILQQLIEVLEPGDIVIDGGNSYYRDTVRRVELARSHGLRFVGAGVSGGEEGALNGPSIMPGGSDEAWPEIAPIFQSIAAHVGGEPYTMDYQTEPGILSRPSIMVSNMLICS